MHSKTRSGCPTSCSNKWMSSVQAFAEAAPKLQGNDKLKALERERRAAPKKLDGDGRYRQPDALLPLRGLATRRILLSPTTLNMMCQQVNPQSPTTGLAFVLCYCMQLTGKRITADYQRICNKLYMSWLCRC